MSNHLAIATVTAALGQIAYDAAKSAVPGVTLSFGRPTAPAGGGAERKLHVYLYLVTPNAALRNVDLPTRNSDGRLTRRPQAALDLHYLLSFFGDEQVLEPDRMLGAVVRDLHARPALTAQLIGDVIGRPELSESDLAAAVESVKFTPAQISLEEMSRLWSVMVQTPHALSVTYVGTVVLIDAVETAPATLPVLQRGEGDHGVDMRIGPFPQLDRYWAGAPVSAARRSRLASFPAAQLGARLVVEGANLGGDSAKLRFAHSRLAPAPEVAISLDDRKPGELHATLPDDAAAQDAWAAGVYGVTATFVRSDKEQVSNVMPVVLAPRIASIAPNPAPRDAGGSVTLAVGCRPKVLASQSATLLLADREVPVEDHAAATATLNFVISAAPVLNRQLVRLRVDGIDSLPFVYDEVTGGFAFDDAQKVSIT